MYEKQNENEKRLARQHPRRRRNNLQDSQDFASAASRSFLALPCGQRSCRSCGPSHSRRRRNNLQDLQDFASAASRSFLPCPAGRDLVDLVDFLIPAAGGIIYKIHKISRAQRAGALSRRYNLQDLQDLVSAASRRTNCFSVQEVSALSLSMALWMESTLSQTSDSRSVVSRRWTLRGWSCA